jgi:SagB-type dehydrogenase family enzyme
VRQPYAPFVRAELYGDGEPALDDPAELYHEASKLYPALAQRQTQGIARLMASDELRAASTWATRRNPQLPTGALPRPLTPRCSLWSTLDRRRSERTFSGHAVDVRVLATLVDAACGVRGERRTIPSGGALYPLELFVAVREVAGVEAGVHRYDAALHALERHDSTDPWPALQAACALPELIDRGSAALLVLAVFGRTRFKYGQRGYRFALLEAGHLAQNVLLAAAALAVPALPLGGFYDSRMDDLVGADGVEESVVYAVVIGGA